MLKKIIVALTLTTIGSTSYYLFMPSSTIKPGMVIILNGPSGAGKSSIQKAFQNIMMPQTWLKMGIDSLFDQPLPDITIDNLDYWQTKNHIRWVEQTKDINENSIITLHIGEDSKPVIEGMHQAIASYARSGNNLIIDYINYDDNWLLKLLKILKELPTILVRIDIPLEVVESREKSRGTSPVGHARSHYFTVHNNIKYDLSVNTNTMSAQECAQVIAHYIRTKKIQNSINI